MTLDEMLEAMETQGYSYEMIAEQIGFGKERVKEALSRHEPPWDYNVLIALTHYFEKRDSKQNVVSESMAYHVEKQQGDYTIADYYALPDDFGAELIDGMLYDMAAPTLFHQGIASEVYRQLANYIRDKKGKCIPFLAPADVQLNQDEYTMIQPDVFLVCRKGLLDRKCLYGAPDWVMEVVSPSIKSKDLILKLNQYKTAGAREYWIVDPEKETVTVHDFANSYFPRDYTFEDVIPMEIYRGDFKIDMAEISTYLKHFFAD